MPGVVVGFLQNDTTSFEVTGCDYRTNAHTSQPHMPVVIYNINAMQIKLISTLTLVKYEHLCFLR